MCSSAHCARIRSGRSRAISAFGRRRGATNPPGPPSPSRSRRLSMFRMLSLILLFVVAPLAAPSEINERVRPFDEGPQNASFVKFRDELKAIIARHDAKALMKIVAPNVQNGFG